ncbi:MAG TPA: Mur ligase family protein, partial [Aquabacterium sp.]|nr:Mur ligase family protein [Aquabacterium sp.]
MLYLNNLTVLILGLGDSGLAMARWCARCGSTVRVADTRELPPQAATLAQDVPAATLHHGLDPALLDGVNLVLKSPGLSPLAPDVSTLLMAAQEQGIPVRGELSLFASALADLQQTLRYQPKVLAITGTNGKTTTTSLTAQLVQRAGLRVGMAGNIGPTLLDTLREALAQEPEPTAEADADVVVPEAASIVLDDMAGVVAETTEADEAVAPTDETPVEGESAEPGLVGQVVRG